MGHIASYRGMEKAIAKVEEFGIGWVSVKDSGHFGVAGLFPMMALKKDFIGYLFTNSRPHDVPVGRKGADHPATIRWPMPFPRGSISPWSWIFP